MNRPFVVVLDPMHEDGITRAKQEADVLHLRIAEASAHETAEALGRADAILLRGTPLTAERIALCTNLRAVAKHGSGVDNIDIAALTERGIPLANTPGGANATAVSEGAVSLMLAVLRRTLDVHRAVLADDFDVRLTFRAGDMWERTVGIIGLGNIGTHVARICGAGFNMRVLAYDPWLSGDDIAARGAEKVELDELLVRSDIITVHTPLTPQTRGIIGARELALMKPEAILVNTSRGGTVDEPALVEALRNKQIAGAGIDVFVEEPPSLDAPLFALEGANVVFSPHNAGLTGESTRQMAIRTAETALAILAGHKPETLLNSAVWERRRRAGAAV